MNENEQDPYAGQRGSVTVEKTAPADEAGPGRPAAAPEMPAATSGSADTGADRPTKRKGA